MSRQQGTIVANPGAIPEMVHMAAGLARAGKLDRYLTPVGSAAPALTSPAGALLPGPLRRRLAAELDRRRLPACLDSRHVLHHATALELLTAGCRRLPWLGPVYRRVVHVRNDAFDRAVAGELRGDETAFVGAYTASSCSLARCRALGIATWLDYPIAHHRFAEAFLRDEARRAPAYAATLQAHTFPDRLVAKLDREIALAGRVFVLSSFQARTFVESGVPAEKLLVVPLGVDLDLFRPAPRRDDGSFRVLFCGQLTQRKGLSYLVDAFRRIADGSTELRLVGQVVGNTRPWRGVPGVCDVPHLPRHELPRIYADADVLVLPSLIEGFGLTALEAMACGRPVIVSEHTFAHDVVREGVDGFVVPVRDVEAIAMRLEYLRDHPEERIRMGDAARGRAEQFSWERYGERIVVALARSCRSPATDAARVPEPAR